MMQGHIVPQWDLDYIKNLDYIESDYNSKKYNKCQNIKLRQLKIVKI